MAKDYWIVAHYRSKCAECNTQVNPGDDVVFSPDDRKVYCEECGPDIAGPKPEGR